MQTILSFPPTVVLRHRKENLNKCTLQGLQDRQYFQFYTYPKMELPFLQGYICLSMDAPPLTKDDAPQGLLILDGTWRYAEKMLRYALSRQTFTLRSLPRGWKTAYPRRQEDCPSPEEGLASIEAIFAAYFILGRDTSGLLDRYYWKENFLAMNLIE